MAQASEDETATVDRRKDRRRPINDTHPIYKTRVKHVLVYLISLRQGRYRSLQEVRSATGVSYIFIISLVRLGLLDMADIKELGDDSYDGQPAGRRYVTMSGKGREVHGILQELDRLVKP